MILQQLFVLIRPQILLEIEYFFLDIIPFKQSQNRVFNITSESSYCQGYPLLISQYNC